MKEVDRCAGQWQDKWILKRNRHFVLETKEEDKLFRKEGNNKEELKFI